MVRSGFKVCYYNDIESRKFYITLKHISYSDTIIDTEEPYTVLTLNRYEA